VIGLLHRDQIARLYASDVDADALQLATRNLALLTRDGLATRIVQIRELLERYGKPSHAQALASAKRLQSSATGEDLTSRLFQADATSVSDLTMALHGEQIDLVITDLPYGSQSTWQTDQQMLSPAWHLLEALHSILTDRTLIAICANKQQKIAHERYRRVDHFQIGKRRVAILRPL
jgi:23S rRNA (guanine2535-N1)-methyltransferase